MAGSFDFDAAHATLSDRLLATLAEHESPSVQASIWIIARAMLERHDEIDEVRMVLPNLHHWLVDLSSFGLDNEPRDLHADDRTARRDRGDRAPRRGLRSAPCPPISRPASSSAAAPSQGRTGS